MKLLNSAVTSKALFIYGFDYYAKWSLMFLLHQDIYVVGFVVEDGDKKTGHKFCNKKVYPYSEVKANYKHSGAIVDVLGKYENKKGLLPSLPIFSCFYANEPLFVYGAGVKGKIAWENLNLLGIDVAGFIDRDELKQKNGYCNKSVLSLAEFQSEYGCGNVVVALDEKIVMQVTKELRCKLGEKYKCFPDPPRTLIWKINDMYGFGVRCILQLQKLMMERKKIILIGHVDGIRSLQKRLRLLDINIAYGVDMVDGFIGKKDCLTVLDKYELLYEDVDSALAIVLNDSRIATIEFCYEHNLEPRMFLQLDFFQLLQLNRFNVLDPNCGYNYVRCDEKAIIKLHTKTNSSHTLRIGILGGSTSDVFLYPYKSWGEALVEILDSENIASVVYCGAKAGYAASQELIIFARDMSYEKLDILISYSGINEHKTIAPLEGKYFINDYQNIIFQRLGKDSNMKICFGNGLKERAAHWLHQERMVHGICQEFGIKFYSLFQPSIVFKRNCSANDETVWDYEEYYFRDDRDSLCKDYPLDKIRYLVRQNLERYSWLYDFSSIFDDLKDDIFFDVVHLTDVGNRILAEVIWDLIKRDTISLLESR